MGQGQRVRERQCRRAGPSALPLKKPARPPKVVPVNLRIEIDRETDGRWIAEVPELPGVMAYGETEQVAIARAKALALRVIADRLENGEDVPAAADAFTVGA